MKKLLSIAAVTVALVSLSSCKKDYTCTCKFSAAGATNQVVEYKEVKKKDAKESCDLLQTNWATIGAGATCELK
jgi:hypothetical protein